MLHRYERYFTWVESKNDEGFDNFLAKSPLFFG